MTDYYTPTTEEVREYYGMGWFAEDDDLVKGDPIRNFDRWYAAESARLRAEGAAEANAILSDCRVEAEELRTQGYPVGVLLRILSRQSFTPVPEETRTVLMTEPHDGHEPSALCPGCPHGAVPEEERTNNVFPNDCLY